MIDVTGHLGLARSLAREFWKRARLFPLEDYRQEACLALCIAAERFDESRGLKFTTYAQPKIRGALIDAHRRWCGYSRRYKAAPMFVDVTPTPPSLGMTEADVELLETIFAGSSRAPRLRALIGLPGNAIRHHRHDVVVVKELLQGVAA